MPQFLGPDIIAPLVRGSTTTITMAGTLAGQTVRITVGGQQYSPSTTMTLSTATSGFNGLDTGTFTAATIYNVFAVVSSGVLGLVLSASTAPTGFTAYKFLGKTIAATGATVSHVMNVGENFYELVYNTATANSTDTTSFGYGDAGVAIGSYTGVQKRSRFLIAATATDSIDVEFYDTAVTLPEWMRLGVFTKASTDTINFLTYQSASGYGCSLKFTGSGSTDVDLVFSTYAQQAAASYGGVGTPWSAFSGVKWRIKKTSSVITAP